MQGIDQLWSQAALSEGSGHAIDLRRACWAYWVCLHTCVVVGVWPILSYSQGGIVRTGLIACYIGR